MGEEERGRAGCADCAATVGTNVLEEGVIATALGRSLGAALGAPVMATVGRWLGSTPLAPAIPRVGRRLGVALGALVIPRVGL